VRAMPLKDPVLRRGVCAPVDGVVEERAANAINAGKGVVSDGSIARRRARRAADRADPAAFVEDDGNPRGGVVVRNPRRAIASDGVVAAPALEFVEKAERVARDRAAGVGAGGAKAGRIEDVGGIAAGDEFDRSQRINANSGWIRADIGDGARGKLDIDRSGRMAVRGAVVAKLANERIVAAVAGEEVIDVAGIERIGAAIAGKIDGPGTGQALKQALIAVRLGDD